MHLLLESGASKSVISSKRFMSIPELFRLRLCNNRMKFQVANGEVLNDIGVAHVSKQMYGYTFKLPIFICYLETLIAYLDRMREKRLVSSLVHEQAESV